MGDMDWVLYAGGYKRAGDILIEHGIAHGGQHILVYPIVFLYRQYIELQLKDIIRNGYRYLGISKYFPPGFPTGHKIDEYWSECRSILKKIDEEEYQKLGEYERNKYNSDLDSLARDIREFSEWDPDSTAFRYPVDKKGNPSIADLANISFAGLKELVERIADLLDAISVGISHYLDAKHENLRKGMS